MAAHPRPAPYDCWAYGIIHAASLPQLMVPQLAVIPCDETVEEGWIYILFSISFFFLWNHVNSSLNS